MKNKDLDNLIWLDKICVVKGLVITRGYFLTIICER